MALVVRTIGLALETMKIGMANPLHNLKRLFALQRRRHGLA